MRRPNVPTFGSWTPPDSAARWEGRRLWRLAPPMQACMACCSCGLIPAAIAALLQTLLDFLEGLLQWAPQAAPTNGHAADAATATVAAAAVSAQRFVTKYLKWLQWYQQVGSCGVGFKAYPPARVFVAQQQGGNG